MRPAGGTAGGPLGGGGRHGPEGTVFSRRPSLRWSLALIGYCSFFFLVFHVASTALAPGDPGRLVLLGLQTATVLFAVLVAIAGLRRRTYLVDPVGIHSRGRFPRDVEVRWDQVGRVEVTRFRGLARQPRAFVLVDRDGSVLLTLNPRAELGTAAGMRLDQALQRWATENKIPVVEIPWGKAFSSRRRGPRVA